MVKDYCESPLSRKNNARIDSQISLRAQVKYYENVETEGGMHLNVWTHSKEESGQLHASSPVSSTKYPRYICNKISMASWARLIKVVRWKVHTLLGIKTVSSVSVLFIERDQDGDSHWFCIVGLCASSSVASLNNFYT
jgi:hypothetical protein